MSEPATPPPRVWDGRNTAIAILSAALLIASVFALRGWWSGWGGVGAGEPVQVFEVQVDRDSRSFVDIVFDRPLGQAQPGEVLASAPATLDPPLAGAWRWLTVNSLRFEPSGGFPVASEVKMELIADRLLGPEQRWGGDPRLTVRTDQFLVEAVEVEEEPVLEARSQVVLTGTVHFNYRVDPEVLAPRIRLEDPNSPGKPVAVELQQVYWSREAVTFRTAPLTKSPEERTVVLWVAGDLTPAEGNVALGSDFRHEFLLGSSEKLAVRRLTATPGAKESTLELQFSSPLKASIAAPYLKVKPEVAYRLAAAGNRLTLTGAFLPGETYEISLGAGLPALDDAVLKEPFQQTVQLADLPPAADFQSQGLFLSARGLRNLGIETVNVQQVDLVVDRVYRNNLFSLIEFGDRLDSGSTYSGAGVAHTLGDRILEKTLRIEGKRNQPVTTVLSLAEVAAEGRKGLLRVQLSRAGTWEAEQRWVLLTDLGAVAKKGEGEVLVWVASSRTLAPAAGATVRLISDQNQELAQGKTDASGLWRFRDKELLAKNRPFLITCQQGEDFTFVYLDRMEIDRSGLEVSGAPSRPNGYSAFLYGERDIYRPGEVVRGMALVRQADLSVPPSMPVVIRHRDSRGRLRESQSHTLDRQGAAELSLPLLAGADTGRHSLELLIAEQVVGQAFFQVEEFVPDRIEVRIEPKGEAVRPGEELAFQVAGTYLFGPPAADLTVESRVRLEQAPFSAKGYEAFIFGDSERTFSNREVFRDQARLDEAGLRSLSTRLVVPGEVPAALQAVVTARVQEAGGRGVTARRSIAVHPYPYYLGLRKVAEGYPEPGQQVAFEFVALSPDGKPVAAKNLTAELILERWNTVLRRTPEGTFRYESTRDSVPVSSQEVSASGGQSGGKGSFSVQVRDYGSHRLRLTDSDTGAAASVQFYVSGWGYSPWAIENPARLQLELDRSEYRPGETAQVLVRAPFAGKLLLTVERGEVFETQLHDLTGNTATIPIVVKGSYRPNVYVTGTLVRGSVGLEPGEVSRAFGAVPLAVDREANRLGLELKAPAELRSQRTLEVEVKTRPGALVTIAAVDEGVLQLIAQKTADPFEFFYRKLALGVSSYDTFSLLFPELMAAGGAGGDEGGGDGAQSVRTDGLRRTKPVAFWSGPVTADGQGVGRVKFELPEFQGALRVMAVAAEDRRFGSAEQRVRVRDPVVLLPTLPRSLSFDERVLVPVTVRNDTGKAATFQVKMEVKGPGSVAEKGGLPVEVANGAEKTLYFTLHTAQEPGELAVVLTAEGGGERTRSSGFVGIRSDLPSMAVREAGALSSGETALAFGGSQFRPGTEERQLSVGATPLVQLAGRLRDLISYPYGCLEQTVSRAFPLLYLRDLAQQLEPELLDPAKGLGDPEAVVEGALARLAQLQLPSGGFALWPGGETEELWSSIYATHFLVEAQRAGYTVGSLTVESSLAFLGEQVRAKSTYGSEELRRMVYALYVLARAGRSDLGSMDFLRQKQAANLAPESRSLLAAAFGAVGDRRAVEELLQRLGKLEEVERTTGGTLESTLRNRALVLLSLLEAEPKSPRIPELADRLAREASSGTAWTTQESSFALLALGQLFHRQAAAGPLVGKVYVGDRLLGSFEGGKPVTFRGVKGTAPLRVVVEGSGAGFFSLSTRGIPTDAAFQPRSAGLEVERRLRSREKGTLNPTEVRQGDVIVIETRVRSVSGPVQNVVVETLLPSGLEVENPRLATTETLPWIPAGAGNPAAADLRDDRVLVFTDLPANSWQTFYTVLRAVAPGSFRLPPAHAEAMYDPALSATGERGTLEVKVRN